MVTRYLSFRVMNFMMIGAGIPWRAFLGFGRRWLMSMSVGWRGGSYSSTSSANETTAAVVSSSSSRMPLIRRLFRLPYCSSTSLWSLSWRTSRFRASIFSSHSARLALRARTSPLRSSIWLTSSWFAVLRTLGLWPASLSSSRALIRDRIKSESSFSWWAAYDVWDPFLLLLDMVGYHSGMLVPNWGRKHCSVNYAKGYF